MFQKIKCLQKVLQGSHPSSRDCLDSKSGAGGSFPGYTQQLPDTPPLLHTWPVLAFVLCFLILILSSYSALSPRHLSCTAVIPSIANYEIIQWGLHHMPRETDKLVRAVAPEFQKLLMPKPQLKVGAVILRLSTTACRRRLTRICSD